MTAPDRPTVVVGAAVVRDGRLLAAQRAAPPSLAGWWELPGGKVEPGESDEDALVRECLEELCVEVRLGARLLGDLPIGDAGILRVWLADLLDGEPVAVEHAALRWLAADELDDVAWLPADRPVVDAVKPILASPPAPAD